MHRPTFLANYFLEKNPNRPTLIPDAGPDARASPAVAGDVRVGSGVTAEGAAFDVEAPAGGEDAAEAAAGGLSAGAAEGFASPPFVVFVGGGPGSGKGTNCARLRDEFRVVH